MSLHMWIFAFGDAQNSKDGAKEATNKMKRGLSGLMQRDTNAHKQPLGTQFKGNMG